MHLYSPLTWRGRLPAGRPTATEKTYIILHVGLSHPAAASGSFARAKPHRQY